MKNETKEDSKMFQITSGVTWEWQIDLQLQNKSSHSPVGQRQFDGSDDYEN